MKKGPSFYYIYKRPKIQSWKKVKLKINLKTVVSIEYHNLLNIFFKKNSDILPYIKGMIIKSY